MDFFHLVDSFTKSQDHFAGVHMFMHVFNTTPPFWISTPINPSCRYEIWSIHTILYLLLALGKAHLRPPVEEWSAHISW